ncbi:MAG TPA: SDR family NAD(P)-dependent oxidoreductase [Rhodanobacteraceae bacterium]|nr:SDR family NAD(P)-dependent oxidoreductase [Rhodanobacteraceae bacterium]
MTNRATPGRDNPAVVANYFATMRHFLETQGRVMSAWMSRGADARASETSLRTPVEKPAIAQSATRRFAPAPSAPVRVVSATPLAASRELAAIVPVIREQVAAPAVAAAKAPLDGLRETLLRIVEEKTGYPRDMVGLDRNLEADLGIDSIKRVEIVGTLLQGLPESLRAHLAEARTQLNTQSTLGGILEIIRAAQARDGDLARVVAPAERIPAKTESVIAAPARSVMRSCAEPVPANAARRLNSGTFLLTADRLGIAEKLASTLRARGNEVVLIERDSLQSEEALIQRCQALRDKANIAGVVHLAALGLPALSADGSPSEWRLALLQNEKALFLLLRELSAHLADDAHVVAASDLGGLFGRDDSSDGALRLAAGAVGTLKSLRKEREKLRVKAIDLDPASGPESLAADLLGEIELVGGRWEVGYPRGQRTIFCSVPETVAADPQREAALTKLVVLATGGARGITAETLRELAHPGNTLILTGRSALENEPAEFAALTDATALRDHFVAEVRAGRAKWNPREIQKLVGNVLAQREMRANIADFEAGGAKVEYVAVDVTDEAGIRALVQDITQRHGPISGVVHGAGIIEDKLLADKASDSWSRVVETKVIGLLLLQKYLDPHALKFFTVFSSVAGRYGNSGQSDYACANELMNRLCVALQSRWGERVAVSALCWGPWGATKFGAGMVTAETEAKFASVGVKLVSAELGRKLFRDELTRTAGTPVEIVCGEAAWDTREAELGAIHLQEDAAPSETSEYAKDGEPLLGAAVAQAQPTGERIVIVELDRARHLYLDEHMLDGKQVLPAAAALEMLAEAGRMLWPGWQVAEVREHKLMKGVEMDSKPRRLRILILPPPYGSSEGFEVTAQLQSEFAPGKMLTHYRAVLRLAQELPEPVPAERSRHAEKSLTVTKAYDEWLFHGRRFRVIEKIEGLSRNGAGARVRVSHPPQWLSSCAADAAWVFDPALLDAAAQMAWLWSRAFRDEAALPARFGRVVRYRARCPERMHMEYERIESTDPSLIRANVTFFDEQGEPVMAIEELDSIASAALNRFGGTANLARGAVA